MALLLLECLTVAGCVTLGAIVGARRQRSPVASAVLGLLLALVLWSGGLAWAAITPVGPWRTVALRASVLGMFAAVGFWFLVALRYRWPRRFGSAATVAVALAPVGVFFLGVVTNGTHGWFVIPGVDWNPGLVAWAAIGTYLLAAVATAYGMIATAIFLFAGLRLIWRGETRAGVALTLAMLSMPLFCFEAGENDPELLLPVTAASYALCIAVLALTALRYQLIEPPPLGHREVIDHLRHAVLMASPTGEVLDFNPAAERMLEGSPRGSTIADCVAGIVAPESRESVRHALSRLSANGQGVSFPVDGTNQRLLEVSAQPIRHTHGEPLGQFAVLRDRTEERQFADAAQRTEKLETLGTLAAGIAHEVNNPLAFVRANLGELIRLGAVIEEHATGGSALAEELRETPHVAKRALSSLERIQRAVSDVRRLAAAPNAGEEAFSIDDVVREAVHLARRRAGALEIETIHGADLPMLYGSAQLLVQAVLSLLLDARQALAETPEPRIEVATGADAEGVFVRVRDNGPGVPAALRGRTFAGSFAGLPDSSQVGLGLSVAAGIASDHGGSLHTDPDASGAGYLLRIAVAGS